jgi:hypothetical protein
VGSTLLVSIMCIWHRYVLAVESAVEKAEWMRILHANAAIASGTKVPKSSPRSRGRSSSTTASNYDV